MLPGRLLLVFAGTAAATSGTIHLAQPLLPAIGSSFGRGPGETGLVMTFGQAGYALGLFAVVPLADAVAPRTLLPAVVGLAAAALASASLSPTLGALYGSVLVLGLAATAGQLVLATTATLAVAEARGRAVGLVMSGLLAGILLARTVSGSVAALAGWRVVYALGAGCALVLALLLRAEVPDVPRAVEGGGAAAFASLLNVLRREPAVRRRALLGALCFAGFNAFWVAVPYLLSQAGYGFSEWQIGLLGLLGIAGISAAPLAGRLADAGHRGSTSVVAVCAIAAAFVAFALGRHHLLGILVGVLLLDGGFQALQVCNQSLIYSLSVSAHGRITSLYMGTVFVGGAVGSGIATQLYADDGWYAVCGFGLVLATAALTLLLVSSARERGVAQTVQ